MSKGIRVTVSMSAEYNEKFKFIAEAEDTSKSRLIRRLIDKRFDEIIKEAKELDEELGNEQQE